MQSTEAVEAYPLSWPMGRKREQVRVYGPFKKKKGELTIMETTSTLMNELKLLGAERVILSTNLRLRKDGLPVSDQAQPADPGVAVYFNYDKSQKCFACDKYRRVQENIRAVALTIEALRGIGRWGTGDMVAQAFSGFAALPAPMTTARPWWDVLEVADRFVPQSVVDTRYRALCKTKHPDSPGGSHEAIIELNAAYDESKGRMDKDG